MSKLEIYTNRTSQENITVLILVNEKRLREKMII